MKTSWDHLLHLTSVEEGQAYWNLTCEHEHGADRWRTNQSQLGEEPLMSDECWLMSWWDDLGAELVDIDKPGHRLPMPVKPSDDWDYENGGRIVFDPSFITQPKVSWFLESPEGRELIARRVRGEI